jgi:lysine 2,3-aminomutase
MKTFPNATKSGSQKFKVSEAVFSSWRWQMSHQIGKSLDPNTSLATISDSEKKGFETLDHLFHAGVTPYYASLMKDVHSEEDRCPIRLQALPRAEELFDSLGEMDPLREKENSPVREVVHVYPDRVAFCVAELCPVYCRYCYRKRRGDEAGLHFNRTIIDRGIRYIAENPGIKDVLITGGDPFIAHDSSILSLCERLREIPHVEIIRFGTRTPVTLPYRVTKELAKGLSQFHPVFVNTHFNCVEEVTEEAKTAIGHLVDHGIMVGNQSVLLKGVNDTPEKMMALLRALICIRVKPYYLFHPHAVAGTEHLRVGVETGLKIMKSLRGNITGMAIPSYIIDTPSGKVPIGHSHILKKEGQDLILEDVRGEIWRERGVLEGVYL